MNTPVKLLTTFQENFTKPQVYAERPRWLLNVPGRELWLAAQPITRQKLMLILPDLDARIAFDRRAARHNQTLAGRHIPPHLRYLPAMARFLADNGLPLPGLFVVIAGSEAPGPRYEHALGMALATLGCDLHACAYDDAHLMSLVERVEKEYL